MAREQTRDHSFPYQGPTIGYRYRRLGVYVPWTFSPETCLICVSFYFAVPSTSIPQENCPPPSEEFELCRTRGIQSKGARQACRSLVNRVRLLALLTDHS